MFGRNPLLARIARGVTRTSLIYAGFLAFLGVPLLALESVWPARSTANLLAALAFAIFAIVICWLLRKPFSRLAQHTVATAAEVSPTSWVLGSVGLGIGLRVVWVSIFPSIPVSDGKTYLSLASALLNGGRYESAGTLAFWPPGYPFFLEAWLAIVPSQRLAVVMANLALFVAASIGVLKLGRHLIGPGGGHVAMALLAIWPNHIALAGVPEKEQVLVATLPWIAWLFIRASSGSSTGLLFVCAGLLMGGSCLVQPSLMLLPLAILCYLLLVDGRVGLSLIRCAILALSMILVIAPWTFRNFQVFGRFVAISTNGGNNLYRANNPIATGGYTKRGEIDLLALSELERDTESKRLAKEWIRCHPWKFVALSLRKNTLFMGDDAYGVYVSLKEGEGSESKSIYLFLKGVANVCWLAFWALLMSVLLSRSGRHPLLPTGALIVPLFFFYLFAVHSIFESGGKYHVPVIALTLLLLPLWAYPSQPVEKS